jgi:multisubunit Na+/H+ antiporter MnhC subunit
MFQRRKTIFVFGLAFVLSVMYSIINLYSKNWLMNWIGTNLIAQTIIIFLTLSGFINIFTPFTIAKEITEKNISEIALFTLEKKKEEDKNNERMIRENSF